MVLEYVHGGELFSHLRREGRFPDDTSRYYAAEIVLAFAYMHSMNIVYRDLKPENLLISTSGHMKITGEGVIILSRILYYKLFKYVYYK